MNSPRSDSSRAARRVETPYPEINDYSYRRLAP